MKQLMFYLQRLTLGMMKAAANEQRISASNISPSLIAKRASTSYAIIPSSRKAVFPPRHHHNFEQIRYVLEGHLKLGNKLYGPGTFMYVPESVYYGPQTRDEDTRIIAFKFPGPSGVPMFTAAQLKRGRDELRADGVTFQTGAAHFPSGKKQDGFEAMWERVACRPIEYAQPRYEEPIYVHPEAFQWRPNQDWVSVSSTLDTSTSVVPM